MELLELYFGENPWPIIIGLLVIAVICLALLFVTQNGRYLIRALIALSFVALLLLIDWAWKTDREKIAEVVIKIANAVNRNDIETLRGQLAPNALYLQSGQGAGVEFQSPLGNTLLRDAIDQMKFDFLSVRDLNVSAGRQTKRGKADFQVLCAGTWLPKAGGSALNFPPTSSSWSFGLQQRKDGSWLVDRITPTQLPGGRSGQSNLPSFLNR
ncbi:MAG: hypothetical protein DWI24_06815 [Planctomycetota bacterium]|nr:MAG: hypothetical protein DWI24_06815 [Planctomycetota bacterium]